MYTQPCREILRWGACFLEFYKQSFCQNPGSGNKNVITGYPLSYFFLLLFLLQVTVISPQKQQILLLSTSNQVDSHLAPSLLTSFAIKMRLAHSLCQLCCCCSCHHYTSVVDPLASQTPLRSILSSSCTDGWISLMSWCVMQR